MVYVVLSEFSRELQELVYLRAPYFLLPESFKADKLSMTNWFARNINKMVLVDKLQFHYINIPTTVYILEEPVTILINYIKGPDLDDISSPWLVFHDNANHRVQRSRYEKVVDRGGRSKIVLVGDDTIYADDTNHTVTFHVYYDSNGKVQGPQISVASNGYKDETLYRDDEAVEPHRSYYPSVNFMGYYSTTEVVIDGVYSDYNDDADNSLRSEAVYEDGVCTLFKEYSNDKLRSEIHYTGQGVNYRVDYAGIFYDSGLINQHVVPIIGQNNIQAVSDATVDELLAGFNITVTIYYDSTRHNVESTGPLEHGVKVGHWYYYNDNKKHTIKTTIDYPPPSWQ